MPLDFSDIPTARTAFRQLYNTVQSIFNWDIKGNRLQNVGDAQNNNDAVNLKQVNDAITKATTAKSSGSQGIAQIIDNLKISTSLTPTLDNTVDIGTTGLRFKKIWAYLIDIATNIKFSGLTASLPLKLDASNQTISAAISLSGAEVTNTLPEAKGGTGTTTVGINGAITFTPSNGTLAASANNGTLGLNVTTVTIQYKDWTGTNLSATIVTAVSLSGSVAGAISGAVAGSITTNNFTNGKRTT